MINRGEISFKDWFDDANARGKGVTYYYVINFNGVKFSGNELVNFYSGDMVNDFDNINSKFEIARKQIVSEKLKQIFK